MKIVCCENCVVDPMCTSGCDVLWSCYNQLKKKGDKYGKISTTAVRVMLVISLFWGIGNMTEYILIDHNIVTIDHLGMVFWYWWYSIGYAIIFSTFLLFRLLSKRVKKTVRAVENSKRGLFIWHKMIQGRRK